MEGRRTQMKGEGRRGCEEDRKGLRSRERREIG